MRYQRTLHRCAGLVAVAVFTFGFPAYARAEVSAYGPKVEPALAELAQAAEAAYADERQQRTAVFQRDSAKLGIDALERRRQQEEAFRNAELQLDKEFAALQLDYEARFAAARTERARAYRAAVARLKVQYKQELRKAHAQKAKLFAQYKRELRQASKAELRKARATVAKATVRIQRLQARRLAALKRVEDRFEAERNRLNTVLTSEQAQRATQYAAAKAQRDAGLRTELEQLDAGSSAALAEREAALATDLASLETKLVETPLSALVFGTDIATARERAGATLRHELPLIDAEAVSIRLGDLRRLADEPGVSLLAADLPTEPTGRVKSLSFTSLDSLYPRIVGAPTAWTEGYTGSGVGIAVLDSGVAPLQDFAGRLTHVSVPGLADAADDQLGHGTFVASVAAGRSTNGRYAGIAPEARVFAVNVSRGNSVQSSDVIKGMEWVLLNRAAPNNIRVLVLSLTESLPSSYRTSALDLALEKLWQKGIVVVVSAGNNGPDTMQYAPANDPFAITVGASDPKGTLDRADDVLADFSSYGKTIDGYQKPEVLAPGRNVVAALPEDSTLDLMAPDVNHVERGYVRMNGTSVAAPQVAGAAAILLQKNPLLTPDQVKWLLMSTSRPVTGSDAKEIDIARAVAYDGELGKANVGLNGSVGPARSGDDDDRKSEFNSGALKEALAWEKAAKSLEKLKRWSRAAEAWDEAARLWLGRLDVAYKAAVDSDLGANAWVKANEWRKASRSWVNAGTAAERVLAWQTAATYYGMAADAAERDRDYEAAARSWEHASRTAEIASALTTASLENQAIAWVKAISAIENAGANWTKKGEASKAAAADARRAALRERALSWANTSWTNTSWTNTSWTNTSWTNTSWTNGEWLNTSWTNTSWTNTSWTNTSWTNTSWNSSSWD